MTNSPAPDPLSPPLRSASRSTTLPARFSPGVLRAKPPVPATAGRAEVHDRGPVVNVHRRHLASPVLVRGGAWPTPATRPQETLPDPFSRRTQ
ncbi:hypothetical protein PsYK624_009760 [Phanerochaete sordida]|uniref:Uncharacterized protein n=1 Tax=Phanerochaete sordida TaxID=48140 RepID=A0A9P3FZA7_9APHY|nr:hypothetical protein PsYK624_009760 [Phanerochaete sordida]